MLLSVFLISGLLLRPLRPLHPLPQQPRSARLVACADSAFRALPPAAQRDVAAELYAATSSANSEIAADAAPPTPMRPLVALTVNEGGGMTLVGEHVQNITSGSLHHPPAHHRLRPATARRHPTLAFPLLAVYPYSLSTLPSPSHFSPSTPTRYCHPPYPRPPPSPRAPAGNMAGTTWLRPLAIRSHRNASGASSDADPPSGTVSPKRIIDSSLHLFANAGRHLPATFVPTRLVRPAACPDTLEVRLLQGVAENPDDVDDDDGDADLADDSARLRRFLSYLAGMTATVEEVEEEPK